MKCIVETDWNEWAFGTIGEARAWFKTLVEYAESGRTDQGAGSRYVDLWRASEWYDDDDCYGPIESWRKGVA